MDHLYFIALVGFVALLLLDLVLNRPDRGAGRTDR